MKLSCQNRRYLSRANTACWFAAALAFTAVAAAPKTHPAPATKANQAPPAPADAPPPFVVLQVDSGRVVVDTLQLPDQVARPGQGDSLSKEFAKYWAQLEKQEGMGELKKQMQANDVDKTKIPHLYLADSNLVIFPGWFILRKKK